MSVTIFRFLLIFLFLYIFRSFDSTSDGLFALHRHRASLDFSRVSSTESAEAAFSIFCLLDVDNDEDDDDDRVSGDNSSASLRRTRGVTEVDILWQPPLAPNSSSSTTGSLNSEATSLASEHSTSRDFRASKMSLTTRSISSR